MTASQLLRITLVVVLVLALVGYLPAFPLHQAYYSQTLGVAAVILAILILLGY